VASSPRAAEDAREVENDDEGEGEDGDRIEDGIEDEDEDGGGRGGRGSASASRMSRRVAATRPAMAASLSERASEWSSEGS
jgi:hypothetical protein